MLRTLLRVSMSIAPVSCAIGGIPVDDGVRGDDSVDVGDAGAGGGSTCGDGEEIVETILPGQIGTKVHALCKSCDRGCDDKGEACDKYGDACNFFGERGVCAACCDGDRGRLRCHPVD
jgi:hypothetical protein